MRAELANATLRTLMEGVPCSWSTDADGFLVARFVEAEISFAATVRVQELQLVAPAVVRTDGSEPALERALEQNERWGVGQICLSSDGAHFDASAAAYLGPSPSATVTRALLEHLHAVIPALRSGQDPVYSPPPLSPAVTLESIEQALVSLGVTPARTQGQSLIVRLRHEQVPVELVLFVTDGAVLQLRGRLDPRREVSSRAAALRAVHSLNGLLTCGSVGLEQRWPVYRLAVSGAWSPIDRETLRWAVSKALYLSVHMGRVLL